MILKTAFVLILGFYCNSIFAATPRSTTALREKLFERARVEVRKQYVGQDAVINQFFDQIRSWYIFPETRVAPQVVTLVGMTSSGKTSLVRSVIKALKLERDYLYFHMEAYAGDRLGGEGGESFVEQLGNAMYEERPQFGLQVPYMKELSDPVLMLDEIQKISTRDPDGSMKERPNAAAVWELLGNEGQLSIENPTYSYLFSVLRNPAEAQFELPDHVLGDSNDSQEQAKLAVPWIRNQLKTLKKELEATPKQTQLNLRHSLVILAANLDSVFKGSNVFDSEALNANDMHRVTSRITATDIKSGLALIFRPEHVNRMGSRMIVFPTLSESDFREYINRRLNFFKEMASKQFQMNISFTDAFRARVYHEGVIPSQGVRPLRAIIARFASDPMSDLYLKIKKSQLVDEHKKTKILVDVVEGKALSTWTIKSGELKGQSFEFPVPGEYIESLSLHAEPRRSVVAARLAAITTAYAMFERELPKAVLSNSRSSGKGGYIETNDHDNEGDVALREDAMKRIAILLSAYVAEEVLFGDVSSFSMAELQSATQMAYEMSTAEGRGLVKSSLLTSNLEKFRRVNQVEEEVESILQEAKKIARSALNRERNFFAALTKRLTETVLVTDVEMRAMVEKYWTEQNEVAVLIGDKPRPMHLCQKILTDFTANPTGFDFKTLSADKKIGF